MTASLRACAVRLHEAWAKRPAPADPKALRLAWQPAQAGVARDLGFGYSTGGFALVDTAKPERVKRGVFFSVWRRDSPNGKWKVFSTRASSTPQATDFVALGLPPRPAFSGRAAQKSDEALCSRARRDALDPQSTGDGSYAALLAPDVRLHRDGMQPFAGRTAVAQYSRIARHASHGRPPMRACRVGRCRITYGKYRETDRVSRVQQGYYAHLWIRDERGRWQLAYDIATPDT